MQRSVLDRDTVLANKEEALIWILDVISPSDLARREDLSSKFEQFIRRGTTKDIDVLLSKTISSVPVDHPCSNCCQLQKNRPASIPSRQSEPTDSLLPSAPESSPISPCSGTNSDITALIRSAEEELVPSASFSWAIPISSGSVVLSAITSATSIQSPLSSLDFVRSFFKVRVGYSQASIALRALNSILTSPEDPKTNYPLEFWSESIRIFANNDSSIPRKRLKNGCKSIDSGSARFEVARHLSHLFYAHDVDEEERLLLGDGQRYLRRKSLAFAAVAESLGDSMETVQREYGRCSNFKYLLEKGGPGSLLFLGIGVNDLWRREIGKASVDAILEYLRDYCPEAEKKARDVDRHACGVIYNGLIAHGWMKRNPDKGRWQLHPESWLMRQLLSVTDEQTLEAGCSARKRASLNGDEDYSTTREEGEVLDQFGNLVESSNSKRQKRNHSQSRDCDEISSASTSQGHLSESPEIAASADTSPAHAEELDYLGSQEIPVESGSPQESSDKLAFDNTADPLIDNAPDPSSSISLDSLAEDRPQIFHTNLHNDPGIVHQQSCSAPAAPAADSTEFASIHGDTPNKFFERPEFSLFGITNGGLEDTFSWDLSWLNQSTAEIMEGDIAGMNATAPKGPFLSMEYDLHEITHGGLEHTGSWSLTG